MKIPNIERETFLSLALLVGGLMLLDFLLRLAKSSLRKQTDYRREIRRAYRSGSFNFPRYFLPPLSDTEKEVINELKAGRIPSGIKIILCFHCGHPNYELSHRCQHCGILLQRSVWDPVYKIFQYGSIYRQALLKSGERQLFFRRTSILILALSSIGVGLGAFAAFFINVKQGNILAAYFLFWAALNFYLAKRLFQSL